MSRQKQETPESKQLLKVLGTKLAGHRDAIGITQTELARRVRVSRFQMCKHESGTAEMPVTRLYEICHALQVSPTDVLRAVARQLKNGS